MLSNYSVVSEESKATSKVMYPSAHVAVLFNVIVKFMSIQYNVGDAFCVFRTQTKTSRVTLYVLVTAIDDDKH
jgi:hypothetical protein